MDHPKVEEGFRKVAEAAKKHGKFAGTVGGMPNAAERLAMGYQFLNIGADVLALDFYFKEIAEFAAGLNK